VLSFPPIPEVPAAQRGGGEVRLDYADICQDGRVMATALPRGIGSVVWRGILAEHPLARIQPSPMMMLPLLTKLYLDAGPQRITLDRPVKAHGGFELASTVDASGATERILANMWVELTGTRGLIYLPAADDAPVVSIGRVYAEHVFTRPFAPPDQRRVTRLDIDGMPEVPERVQAWRPPETLLELPAGARALDDQLVDDPVEIQFGLHHTDSNQHVNSLVYPRLFEDVALRRIAAHGRSTRVLARQVEVAYRKPCFAGDAIRVATRAFELDGDVGAVGAFFAPGQPDRPHCCVRMLLSP